MKRALSHASDRTSTTESSLHLQGRTKEADHAELAAFINEEKFQADRIVAQRGQRERDRRHVLEEDRGIRGFCYRFMQNTGIQALSNIVALFTFILVIVLANAAADMLNYPENNEALKSYQGLEVVMTVLITIYIVEVIISFIGCPIRPRIYDGWLMLDIFVATIAFLDEFVFYHFHSAGILRTTRAVRMLRILRVGRILRLISMIRNFPLLAMVVIETTTRLGWMFVIWSVIGWCSAAIITVVVGSEGYADAPEIEDPLMQAIIQSGPVYPLEPEEVLRGLGGALLLMNMMPMRLVYWGPSLWKLLQMENRRLNVAGVLLLLYASLCVIWIWPMVVGCFISVLRDGQRRLKKNQDKNARKMQEFKVEDLIDIFEDIVGDSEERFISLDDFREMQRMHPNFAALLGGTGKSFAMTDAIFREFDIMNLNHLTLPDFVLGVLKLLRVIPKPEFSTIDEQQRRALKNFNKASGGNRFSFLVTSRYMHEFGEELHRFVTSSSHVMKAEVKESIDSSELSSPLPAVTPEEEKALKSGFMAKLQEKYNFRQRLLLVEESLEYFHQRQHQDAIQQSFEKVAQEILHEDIMPWLKEEMPSYLQLWEQAKRGDQQRQMDHQRHRVYLQLLKQEEERGAKEASGAAFRLSSLPASSAFSIVT